MTRAEARQQIREVAATQRRRTNVRMARTRKRAGHNADLLPLPKLEQAVCIVRRKQLVDDEVLAAAGFRPGRGRKPDDQPQTTT